MTGREKVTYHLKRMSAEQASAAAGTSSEDMENAGYFRNLSSGNQTGTLSIKEAEEVSELFEGDSPVIIDIHGARWVEIE